MRIPIFTFLLLASTSLFGIAQTNSASVPEATPKPASQPATVLPPLPDNLEVIHNVEMGRGGDRILHAEICQPKNPSSTPMPAVIFIHGGGWVSGSYKLLPTPFLAEKGYFTADIEYRFDSEAKWPAQIEDCKLAVRWLRANAAKYNVDPNRIGVWGHSAGGHLVACLGTMGDQAQFEGGGGYPGVSSKVQAVVDFSGPIDFTNGSDAILKTLPGTDAKMLVNLFGKPYSEAPEVWKGASPIAYVQAGDPPFLIAAGDNDPSVSPEQAVRMTTALQKVGVPVQYISVPKGGHLGSFPNLPADALDKYGLRAAVLAFFDKYLKN